MEYGSPLVCVGHPVEKQRCTSATEGWMENSKGGRWYYCGIGMRYRMGQVDESGKFVYVGPDWKFYWLLNKEDKSQCDCETDTAPEPGPIKFINRRQRRNLQAPSHWSENDE